MVDLHSAQRGPKPLLKSGPCLVKPIGTQLGKKNSVPHVFGPQLSYGYWADGSPATSSLADLLPPSHEKWNASI